MAVTKRKSANFKTKYYDIKYPASYTGKTTFLSSLKPGERDAAEKWLNKERTYLIHKTVPRKYKRLPTVAGFQQQVQGDLIDLSYLSQDNDKNRYLFTVIDAFSRLAFAEAIPNKEAKTVAKAFEKILKRMNYKPLYFFSDNGSEFRGEFRKMLTKKKISYYTSKDKDIKAGIVERLNRTIMTRLFRYLSKQNSRRYLEVLPNIIENYNNQVHSAIGTSPKKVSHLNKEDVWLRLHHKCTRPSATKKKISKIGNKSNLKIGDYVLIPKERRTFEKGYKAGWTGEIFKINKIKNTEPPSYILEDLQGEKITGIFYRQELQKTELPEIYEIETILDVRGKPSAREYFVKWRNYPAKFNQCVPAKSVSET